MELKRAYITGLGFVTPIGNSYDEVKQSLLEGRSGVGPMDFGWAVNTNLCVAGQIKEFDCLQGNKGRWKWPEQYKIPNIFVRNAAPHGVYCFCALQQAMADANFVLEEEGNEDAGLYAASAGSPMLGVHYGEEMRKNLGKRCNPALIPSSVSGTLNLTLAPYLGIKGANVGFVSACSSSAHAIGYALDDLRLGRVKRAFIITGEDIGPENVLAFSSLRVLSLDRHEKASRPFDRTRNGFVMAGGGVVLMIENEDEVERRGAKPYCRVAGWGQSADGFAVSISHPEGIGVRKSFGNTLRSAGWSPKDVNYINAHATSTTVGDKAEGMAIRKTFLDEGSNPVVSSTKAITGHGISMAGGMEAAFCALAIREGFMPGNAHLDEWDPDMDGLTLPKETVPEAPTHVLSNSSGFGGSNVCLAFEKV